MPDEQPDAGPRPPQEAAGELARMGIDPAAVGLDEPATVMLPPSPGGMAGGGAAAPAQRAAGEPGSAETRPLPPQVAPPAREHPAVWPATALSRPLTPEPAGALPPPAPASGVELAQRLYPEELGLVVPAGWRRLVRAASLGLFAPGAAAAMERERWLVSRVRARQSEPRTIAFIAGKGGVGATTTSIGVGLTLATLRTDETVLVDGRTGTRSLGERVAEMRAPTTLELADESDRRMPLSYRSRLHLIDAPPWHVPPDPSKLSRLLARLRESFQFIAIDGGNETGASGQAALSRADQAVIVTPTSSDAVGAARVALGRIQHTDPALLTTLTVAVVCLAGRGHQKTVRALRDELGLQESRIVPVPYDPGLVSGDRFDPDRLRTVTREAYLRLAALLASPADTPPAPGFGGGQVR